MGYDAYVHIKKKYTKSQKDYETIEEILALEEKIQKQF